MNYPHTNHYVMPDLIRRPGYPTYIFLDSGFRRNDECWTFYEAIIIWLRKKRRHPAVSKLSSCDLIAGSRKKWERSMLQFGKRNPTREESDVLQKEMEKFLSRDVWILRSSRRMTSWVSQEDSLNKDSGRKAALTCRPKR